MKQTSILGYGIWWISCFIFFNTVAAISADTQTRQSISNSIASILTPRAPRPPIDTGDSTATGNIGTQFATTTVNGSGTGSGTTDGFINGGNDFSTPQAILGTTNSLDLVIRTGVGSMPGQARMAIAGTGEIEILAGNQLDFFEPTSTYHSGIKANPSLAATTATLLLPTTDGLAGQILSTNGTGVLSWTDAGTASGGFTNGGNAFGTAQAIVGSSNNIDFVLLSNGLARVTIAAAGQITVNNGYELRFEKAGDATKWSGFKSNPATTINNTWTLPANNGTNNQILTTDGAGTLSWTNRESITTNKACAYRGADVLIGGTGLITVLFDQITFNPGGNYAPLTGVFTAPVTGTYLVTTQICVQIGNSGTKKINIYKGLPIGAAIPGCTGKIIVPTFSFSLSNTDTYTIPLSTMVSLTAGEQIRIVYTGDAADTIIGDGTELAVHFISQ